MQTKLKLTMLCVGLTLLWATGAWAQVIDQGFNLDAGDLRFIRQQIRIAEAHAAGGQLLGPGPNQVNDPRLPFGLRTVDGSFNNLIADQQQFGAADRLIPRMTTPFYRPGELFDPDGPGPAPAVPTSYTQTSGAVADSQPRIISNLIVDQTSANPSAVAAATALGEPCLTPGVTCFVPNATPDVGLSAPFNPIFTFFGQFFDHGLTLLTKGGGAVFIPLQPDDPQYVPGSPTNFMVLTRATNQPGPDGVLGTADDIKEGTNTTTPFVDQNQTYTSHPSHQVFLREYALDAQNRPVATGRLIDGAIAGNIGNWAEVKAQARSMLGINLADTDLLNVPLLATDPYGRFLRGPNGFPQIVTASGLVEGNPAANGGAGIDIPADAMRTGHAFLDDIAHHAVPVGDHDNDPATPKQPLTPDSDPGVTDDGNPTTYDDELLNLHFITGDGRGNENIALTAVHTVFHSEHNQLADDINTLLDTLQAGGQLSAAEIADWRTAAPGLQGWDYGERLFQAARFVTEMEYQHLVFEEFARKVQPQVNLFAGYQTEIDPAITAEFSHAAFRFGHSMLTETIARRLPGAAEGDTTNDVSLVAGFLNPPAFNNVGASTLTASEAAGSILQGLSRQVGNEIDEFVTEALRNQLLGLPLDLATINLSRGRSEGIPPLNVAKAQFYAITANSALAPYPDWYEFGLGLRHPESLVNFIAAYGIHPTLQAATTLADKRAAATALLSDPNFMFAPASENGVDTIDFWVGGLAEKISPFGGLLGSTFNFVFEKQLENLQSGDRFYYLSRTQGLNLLVQLEGNSLAELTMRNTSVRGVAADLFSRADLVFNLANLGTAGPIPDDPTTAQNESLMIDLVRLPDGTIRYTGPLHVTWNGTDDPASIDRIWSSDGDDTLRGSAGVDIMEGGAGNDQFLGGLGDDILTDTFGDDVLKGGDGNDALSSGPGFDLNQGGTGKDFIWGGSDPTETFGGAGDDFIFAGDSSDTVFGDTGDDWMEGGDQADLLQGGMGARMLDSPDAGHNVFIGGGGDDDYDGETGDDIMVAGVGIERNAGMTGFDWVTHRGDPQPANADLNIAIIEHVPDVNVLRDRYAFIEGLSGWNFDDVLRGSDADAFSMVPLHVLTIEGIHRIEGLSAILPAGTTSWSGGDIILGGGGSDTIMGRAGDDFIDGDAWLNVQLRAPNPGTPDPADFQLVDSMSALRADVFARRINPGDITIVRSISTAGVGPTDVDTAVFRGRSSEYTITNNPDGTVTVTHNIAAGGGGGNISDGVDTLRNIEMLLFADGAVSPTLRVSAPSLSFPTQVVGTTSAPLAVTLTNTGAAPIALIAFSIAGVDAAEFDLTSGCDAVLAAGASCTSGVTFTPAAGGTRSATLTINSSDPLTPLVVQLTGVGSAVPATQNLLTLNPVTTPTAAATQEISGTVLANATTPVVTVNGVAQSASVAGANFSAMITLAVGTNVITVSSTDTNTGVPTIISTTIIRDITPPIVTLNPVASPTGNADQLLTGTVEAGTTVTVSVNGGAPISVNVTGALLSAQITGLADGANTITVTAADPAGNRTSVTATVTVVLPTGSFKGGPVSMSDALKALRMAVGIVTPTTEELLRGDCAPLGAPDGRIDVSDALLILKKIVGLVNF